MVTKGRLRELFSKYGKVGLGVHMSVSAISIAGLYVAIENNVDVESLLDKIGLQSHSKEVLGEDSGAADEEMQSEKPTKGKLESSELLKSGGGALALAVLCNKALFPVRVPITIALTPPIARFLARRRLIKDNFR